MVDSKRSRYWSHVLILFGRLLRHCCLDLHLSLRLDQNNHVIRQYSWWLTKGNFYVNSSVNSCKTRHDRLLLWISLGSHESSATTCRYFYDHGIHTTTLAWPQGQPGMNKYDDLLNCSDIRCMSTHCHKSFKQYIAHTKWRMNTYTDQKIEAEISNQ